MLSNKLIAKLHVCVIVLLPFTISLFLKAFSTSTSIGNEEISASVWKGWEVLASGWLGIFDGTIAWYSNLFLFYALFAYGTNPKSCLRAASMGFAISLTAFFYGEMWLDESYAKYANVGRYGAGFYLWLLSHATMLMLASKDSHRLEQST